MKKTTTRTETCCDLCHRPGYVTQCNACGCDMCLICKALMAGCMMDPGVCRTCGENPDVMAIVHGYSGKFKDIYVARRTELHTLRDAKKTTKKGGKK